MIVCAMQQEIQVGDRTIGANHPLFIVAECGITCNYDLDISKKLIDTVAESGADAIKFIFWFPDETMSDHDVPFTYKTVDGTETKSLYEMVSELRFTLDEWKEVKKYADEKGVILFSTVNTHSGAEWAEELGLDAYKLSSWDFNHIPLWRRIAGFKKPMIIDTGPVHMHEVAHVLHIMEQEGNDQAVLVHCYHTDLPEQINMRSIPYMHKTFNAPVGFSAVDYHDEMDIVAVSLGSVFLEKRLTLKRDLPGHHHAISKEPDEFKAYVEMVRTVHASLGKEQLKPSDADLEERKRFFRRIVANRDLPKGTVLEASDLEGKRPEEGGLSPEHMHFFLGRELKRDLKEDEPIMWQDV